MIFRRLLDKKDNPRKLLAFRGFSITLQHDETLEYVVRRIISAAANSISAAVNAISAAVK